MRSIGARLTLWYAVSATVTFAVLFLAGDRLLESRMIGGLDALNAAEFRQLKQHLGADYRSLDSRMMDQRIREVSESGSTLFYVSVERPKANVRFKSHNLRDRDIPDVKGARAYSVGLSDTGPLRVDEFLLPPFDVTIATSARPVADALREYARIGAALLATMLIVSIGIGFGLSRLLLSPLRAIRETASRIGSNSLSERIPMPAVKDELSELALLLNRMFERLETAFDQVRRFSDEASHELKTPLSLIRLHAETMLNRGHLAPADLEAVLIQIQELARLNELIDGLLFLSRAEAKAVALQCRERDPVDFLEAFSQDAQVLAEHTGRRFVFRHDGFGLVTFDETWIRRVLLNLLTNALNVSPANGLISLRSRVADGRWRVSVEDEGPGLPPEHQERIFERFVRVNPQLNNERGSGLGLAISRSILTLHGGRIMVAPGETLAGLCVTFEIPVGAM